MGGLVQIPQSPILKPMSFDRSTTLRVGTTRNYAIQRFSAAGIAAATLIAMLSPLAAKAQLAEKMIQGKVEANSGRPLSNAIVYLKDTRSLDVKSYITQPDGVYRFGQISSNDDYKLWAELNEKKSGIKKSGVKTISSFDDKKNLLINLHIDTEK